MGEILQGFNDDMYNLALFIDLRKAFDCVDLCNGLRYGNSILFLDDTTLYLIGRNVWLLKQNMQAKLVN